MPDQQEAPRRGPGRVSTYSPIIADEIVDRIADGQPLAVICRDEHMPAYRTVYDWMGVHPDFAAAIARARKIGFDVIAERARLTIRGKTEEEGGESSGDVQRDKAIVDTDLKLLAKWDPRRYGDKLDLTSSDGSMSQPSVIQIVPVQPAHDSGPDQAS
jgi:hypothetical protein